MTRSSTQRPLQVYFSEAELGRLDGWARTRGLSKSEAVRRAVGKLLEAGDDMESAIERARTLVRRYIPEGTRLSDDLIRERRAEADGDG